MDNIININSIIGWIQVLTIEGYIDRIFVDKETGMVYNISVLTDNFYFKKKFEQLNLEIGRKYYNLNANNLKFKFIIGEHNQIEYYASVLCCNPFTQKTEVISEEYVNSMHIDNLVEVENIEEGTLIRFVEDYLNNNELSVEHQKLLNVLRDTRFYRFSDNCHDFVAETYLEKDKTRAFYAITYDYLKTLLQDIFRKNKIKYTFNEISYDKIEFYGRDTIILNYYFVNEQTLLEIYNNYPLLQDLEVTKYDKLLGKGKENERTGLLWLSDKIF